jgi:hypothetical protein
MLQRPEGYMALRFLISELIDVDGGAAQLLGRAYLGPKSCQKLNVRPW